MPFTFWRDPIGVGVGVIGLEIMVAVALSIIVQRFLGYSRWRALHTLTYVAFTLVVAHVLISGSDAFRPHLAVAVLGAWLSVVVLWLVTTPLFARCAAGRRLDQTAAARRSGGRRMPSGAPGSASANTRHRRCSGLRGDGRLAYRASVPAEEAMPVIRAVKVCPARAITLSRVPTTGAAPPEPATEPPDQARVARPSAGPPRRPYRPTVRDEG